MKKLLSVALLIAACSLSSASLSSAVAADTGQYESLIVNRFIVQEGIEFPLDYLATLQEELVSQLQKGTFNEVLREGEKPSTGSPRILRLEGTVIEFHAGSRVKRYMVGFGAGKTKIVAHVRFIDQSNGLVVFEKNVDGKVIIGFIGGDSLGATRGLAKEVKELAAKQF